MGKRISRIDLADHRDLDHILLEMLKLMPDLQPPVPIEELAADLDILEIRDLTTEGFAGALLTDADRSSGIILVKKGYYDQRRRFTIGHELGHFLCPMHVPTKSEGFFCTSGDMKLSYAKKDNVAAQMEVQANKFSAHLLVPGKLLHPRIRPQDDPNLEDVLKLSDVFNTSKEMMARRYVESHPSPCAAVFSKDRVVSYPVRQEDFPRLPFLKDKPVPKTSVTAKVRLKQDELTAPAPVDPAIWLEDDQAHRVEFLSEQVLGQDNGYRITLLAAVVKDDEEEEEEKNLRESWTPRFR